MTDTSRSRPSDFHRASTALLDALHDATQAVLARIAPDLQAEGLSQCSFWTLYRLASGESDRPVAIARELHVSTPSVTQSVDQLVEAGLVLRRRSESDRRAVQISLTPSGRRTLGRVLQRMDRTLAGAFAPLPPSELEAAARLLREAASRLRDEALSPILARPA